MPKPKPDVRITPTIDSKYAAMTGRKMFLQTHLEDYDQAPNQGLNRSHPRLIPYKADDSHLGEANLISSEVGPNVHMPVIDCDFPINTVASSTPGHFHLYIDKEMTWQQYKALLDGMLNAGLIQKAWYENAMDHQRTYVRMPHVRKAVA
jgi:hypothetical protein